MPPPLRSGYLQVYNDWDALAPSLASMAPHIDELVVVDGAYQGMAEYLSDIGKNPARSDAPVHDILARFPKPVTYVTNIWKNEIEKRIAGFSACRGRYIYRLDADEVIFMDEARLAAFMASPAGVAQMEMPTYVAPGWISTADPPGLIERQSFLFDRHRISAEEHLDYLGLALTTDRLPVNRAQARLIFPEPIAFNVHLNAFRSPDTSHQRSAFYQMNFMRQHGVPWLPALANRPIADSADLLEHVSAQDFLELMYNSPNSVSLDVITTSRLRRSPLLPAQEAGFLPVIERYFASHARRNAELRTASRACVGGGDVYFDISRAETLAPLVSDGRITIHFSTQCHAASATIHCLIPRAPWRQSFELTCRCHDNRVVIDLPPDLPPLGACALRVLSVVQHWRDADPIQRFSLAPLPLTDARPGGFTPAKRLRRAAMSSHAVAGDLRLLSDGTAEGWVWSPDLPGQRLVAEILVNDVSVAAIVSARFQRDLLEQGVGDGHHGFRLRLPPGSIPPTGPVVITGRERRSRQVFARIVRAGPSVSPRRNAAIDATAGRVRNLWNAWEGQLAAPPGPGQAARLREAFGQLSARLAGPVRAGGVAAPVAASLARLRRRTGRLDLPLLEAPALSVVLPAGAEMGATLRRLRALAPVAAQAGAELLLLDDGGDAATMLLPALVPNLAYVRAPGAGGGWAEAARAARGASVTLLDPAPDTPSAAALLALARLAASVPRAVLLGPAAWAAGERVGALSAAGPSLYRAPARLGLRIALARDLLVQAGGLEPCMADGAALECVDLWLRCRLLGAVALAWIEPARPPGEARAGATAARPRAAWQALATFQDRWPHSAEGRHVGPLDATWHNL